MPEKVVPGPVSDERRIREAVCIHTKKIFDSCKEEDIASLILILHGLTPCYLYCIMQLKNSCKQEVKRVDAQERRSFGKAAKKAGTSKFYCKRIRYAYVQVRMHKISWWAGVRDKVCASGNKKSGAV